MLKGGRNARFSMRAAVAAVAACCLVAAAAEAAEAAAPAAGMCGAQQCPAEAAASLPGRALLQVAGALGRLDPKSAGPSDPSATSASSALGAGAGAAGPVAVGPPMPLLQPAGGDPVASPEELKASLAQVCPAGYMEVTGGRCTLRPATAAEVWVKVTNIYRCMHGSPPVTWSVAVAQNAQSYVNTLTSLVHSSSYSIPPPAGPAGENLAMGYGSIEAALTAWYNEVSSCSWPGCEYGSGVTGHFTALVWAGVSQIGCAVNTRDIYICRYWSGNTLSDLTANMAGAYEQNVLRLSKTADSCIQQFDGSSTPTTITTTITTTTRPPSPTPSPAGGALRVLAGPCTVDTSGCVTSPGWPAQYGTNQACTISAATGVAVSAASFSTEQSWDKLRVAGRDYSGTAGPQGVVPTGDITWTSDSSVVAAGWRLCGGSAPPTTTTTKRPTTTSARTTTLTPTTRAPTTAAPTTAPTTAPAGGALRVVGGPCMVDTSGCVTSPGWPAQYGNNQACTISAATGVAVSATSFATEANYDLLRVAGRDYSGTAGPQGVLPTGSITWTSDSSQVAAGWRLCATAAPPATVTTTTAAASCSPPALGSRAVCQSCITSSQCASGMYCCPFMKKCVQSSSTACYGPIANCVPSCSDSGCQAATGCSCTSCSNVGPGKTYDWLVWANLRNSETSSPVRTCT